LILLKVDVSMLFALILQRNIHFEPITMESLR